MNRTLQRVLVAAALAWLMLPPSAAAADSQDACVGYIGAQPILIRTPGTWCLRENVISRTDAHAVQIRASDVTIDCNGFTLSYTGPTAYNFAISADSFPGQAPFANISIRNCTIKNFLVSVGLAQVNGGLVENSRFDGGGVQFIGGHGTARGNVFRNAGLIARFGDFDLLDNRITGVNARAYSGITVHACSASIRGNVVSGGAGIIADQGAPKIRDNVLTGNGTGAGIDCSAGTVARLKDNLVTGYATPTQGCIDAGGNRTAP